MRVKQTEDERATMEQSVRGQDLFHLSPRSDVSGQIAKIIVTWGYCDSIKDFVDSHLSYYMPEAEANKALEYAWQLPRAYQRYCEYIVDNHLLCLDKLEAWDLIKGRYDKHIWSRR